MSARRPSSAATSTASPASPSVAGRRLTRRELHASLDATLAAGPPLRHGLWVFGYGSLIWKPEFAWAERAPARVHGYHRRLCLRSVQYRGTPECPGIVAGLDRGGSCAGVLYRLPPDGLRAALLRLWEREMFMNSYAARWLAVRRLDRRGADGAPRLVTALAFVVRHDAPNYAGRLSHDELIEVLGRACGRLGTSLDYLLCTVEALRADGLSDPHLERLAAEAQRRCRPAARALDEAPYDAARTEAAAPARAAPRSRARPR